MPGTLSTITSVFPPEERAKAVGIWAGFAGTGGTLGLLASGALLEGFYWGSIFLVTAGARARRTRRCHAGRAVHQVERARRPRPHRFGALRPRHRAPRARDHRGTRAGLDQSVDTRSARRAVSCSSPRSFASSCAARPRCSTHASSGGRASPPGRRRCSSSSSPCSGSSSCRCSSSSSCSATARSLRRSRCCRCRCSSCRCRW